MFRRLHNWLAARRLAMEEKAVMSANTSDAFVQKVALAPQQVDLAGVRQQCDVFSNGDLQGQNGSA